MLVFMKTKFPTLSPLLRSDSQGLMLAALYLDASREFTLSELARVAGSSVPSIMRDVDRLIEAEYLLGRRVGRSRLVRVNVEHPLTRPLGQLVLYAYGPQVVIHREIAGLKNVKQAFVFGSWAERIMGTPGHNPGDIDVLLIGDISMRQASDLSARASSIMGREVNVQVMGEQDWNNGEGSFLKTVKSRPLVAVELEALGQE